MSRLSKVEGLGEYHMIISEDELNIIFIDAEDIAKARGLKFAQERVHVGEYFFKKIEGIVGHGRLHL